MSKTQVAKSAQQLSTGGHLAPMEIAEVAWAHGYQYALSYCMKGRVSIASKETARIVEPGESPREFCQECVAAHNEAILAQMLAPDGDLHD